LNIQPFTHYALNYPPVATQKTEITSTTQKII